MVFVEHPLNDHNHNQTDDNIMNKRYSQEEEGGEQGTETILPNQDDDALVDALRSLAIRLRSENETLKESERAASA
eukprot:3927484-Ditylum_brightwellii.AAC.1